MAKAIFSDRNYIPDATLAGGSYEATLPVTNAQVRPFSKLARTTDATTGSTYFTVDLGSSKNTGILSILKHNITDVESTVRFRASDTAGATTDLVYDSGSNLVLPRVYDWVTHDFYEPNWFYGEPYPEDLALFTKQFIHIPSESVRARYWRIDIDDTSNSDGYVQFGYFYQAPIYRPTVDIQLGSGLTLIDNTNIQRSLSGVEYFDNRDKTRVISIGVKGLLKDEMLSSIFNLVTRQGKGGLVYIIPDSADTLNLYKEAFLGRFVDIPTFNNFTFNYYETAIQIKEVL